MEIFNDLMDPGYRYRAKEKVKELEKMVEIYKVQYTAYEEVIDELNNAKVSSLIILKEIENYINSIANKPKELLGVIVTPNYEQENYETSVKKEKEQLDKFIGRSVTIGVMAMASVAFLPLAAITIPVAYVNSKKEKEENQKLINGCNGKIVKIRKEIKNIQSLSNGNMAEQEFLNIYSSNTKKLMSNLQKTGIVDYSKFTEEQKSDLGVLVTSAKTLIKRLDGR